MQVSGGQILYYCGLNYCRNGFDSGRIVSVSLKIMKEKK